MFPAKYCRGERCERTLAHFQKRLRDSNSKFSNVGKTVSEVQNVQKLVSFEKLCNCYELRDFPKEFSVFEAQ